MNATENPKIPIAEAIPTLDAINLLKLTELATDQGFTPEELESYFRQDFQAALYRNWILQKEGILSNLRCYDPSHSERTTQSVYFAAISKDSGLTLVAIHPMIPRFTQGFDTHEVGLTMALIEYSQEHMSVRSELKSRVIGRLTPEMLRKYVNLPSLPTES